MCCAKAYPLTLCMARSNLVRQFLPLNEMPTDQRVGFMYLPPHSFYSRLLYGYLKTT